MNRAKKVIRVLEGFKLGDLGAGTKKLAPQPEPQAAKNSSIKFIDVRANPDHYQGYMRGVKWSEGEMNFFLELGVSQSGETYDLMLYGGRGDRVKIPKSNMVFKKLPKFPDFSLQLKFHPKDKNEASEQMNKVMRAVRSYKSFAEAWKSSGVFDSTWALIDHGYFKEYMKLDS